MPQLSAAIEALKASSTVAFNTKAKELARSGVDVVAMYAEQFPADDMASRRWSTTG